MYVAFLRGLNVGGRNRIAMTDLSATFEASGATGVRTYIQSGNVLFHAPDGKLGDVVAAVKRRISARLDSKIAVAVRAATRLRAIATEHPFQAIAADPRQMHVGFLRERPSPEAVARLDPNRSPPDRLLVRDCEIYPLLPNGVARTKLSNAYFDSVLGIPSTFRNWRTVRTLATMTDAEKGQADCGLELN